MIDTQRREKTQCQSVTIDCDKLINFTLHTTSILDLKLEKIRLNIAHMSQRIFFS